jgi:hypothetical protein
LEFVKDAKGGVVGRGRFEVIIEGSYGTSPAARHALRTFLVVIAVDLAFW